VAYTALTNVTSVSNLINNIVSFAGENGWTVRRNADTGGNRLATIYVPGVSDNVHLYNTVATRLGLRLSVGYDGALPPASQPNVATRESITTLTAPFPNVYLFANGINLHIVVQIANAVEYRHICIGMIDKAGTWTGGTYADGSYREATYLGDIAPQHHLPFAGFGASSSSNSAPFCGTMRVDVPADNYLNNFGIFTGNETLSNSITGHINSYGTSGGASGAMGRIVEGADRNSFSGRSIVHPIRLFFVRATNTRKSYIGSVNGTYLVDMAKFSETQEITIGTDVYKLFPFFKRSLQQNANSNSPDYGSHMMGFAIRKTA
jgi:hypothetical protein